MADPGQALRTGERGTDPAGDSKERRRKQKDGQDSETEKRQKTGVGEGKRITQGGHPWTTPA